MRRRQRMARIGNAFDALMASRVTQHPRHAGKAWNSTHGRDSE
jgi:hypothetical protein